MPHPLQPGAKLFFPNVVMQIVRSNLPPHQCVFRCPPALNKIDIKAYLTNLYNINISDVRTMNYSPQELSAAGRRRQKRLEPKYKKVIVTMEEDFNFPPPPQWTAKSGENADMAVKLPPRVLPGKGSANWQRHKLEEGRKRGVIGQHARKQKELALTDGGEVTQPSA
ncbi:hypothetical protein BC832DRAFT_558495 [Gaertneriomyces semiglobifer]|nr:hypothetical protein BC832DRAFT_558495 [Gaertneriomyces semiglobifer]